jgi:hypothetical protein
MEPDAEQEVGSEPIAKRSERSSNRWIAIWILAQFVAPWAIYGALLWQQPTDPFAAWHRDVYWPAQNFLAHSQGGLVLPIFAHLMVGTVGGLFATVAVLAVLRLVVRLGVPRQLGETAAALFVVILPMWAFVFVKAVPETVTVIDRGARRVEVHHFQLFLRFPTGVETIGGDDIRAFDLSSSWNKRAGERFLRLFAYTRDGKVLELAERACDSSDETQCFAEADADLLRLAEWLGHPSSQIVSNTKSIRHGIILSELSMWGSANVFTATYVGATVWSPRAEGASRTPAWSFSVTGRVILA